MIDYVVQNRAIILEALAEHVWLSLLPVLIGAVLAVPVGYAAVRWGWLYQPIVNVGGVIYSIPSLALFVILPALLSTQVLDPVNIVAALSLYTFALLTRTVADALRSVQGEATQAAFALGYRPVRQLFGVEIPMALPVMLAGLRVATVANISLVSVGAIIGVGGLGALFTRGLQLDFIEPIIVGIVLSVLLAAVCDTAIVLTQRWLTPWARVGAR
jgi:osmoprotectant transport system permease protein